MKKRGYISVTVIFILIFLCLLSGCAGKAETNLTETVNESSPSVGISEKYDVITTLKDNNTTDTTQAVTNIPETQTVKETVPQTVKVTEKTTVPDLVGFWDNAVFVGDSVTMGLRNFVTSERNKGNACLGNAQFLTGGSMGYSNTLPEIGTKDSIHPIYKGREMYIEDALALIKADKVFIMLGMNDFDIYTVKDGITNAVKCINRIKEKNPDTKIYIESVTPVNRDRGDFTNANIDIFNAALKKMCAANGCTYVDIASVMKNENGALIEPYCSDPNGMGIHMNYAGCRVWVDHLNKLFAEEK